MPTTVEPKFTTQSGLGASGAGQQGMRGRRGDLVGFISTSGMTPVKSRSARTEEQATITRIDWVVRDEQPLLHGSSSPARSSSDCGIAKPSAPAHRTLILSSKQGLLERHLAALGALRLQASPLRSKAQRSH
jgi:hypothetical protein